MQCFLKPVQAESGSLGAFGFPESGVRECHFVQKDHVFENQCRLRLGHCGHLGFQNLPRWPFLLFALQNQSLFVNPLSGLLFVLTVSWSKLTSQNFWNTKGESTNLFCVFFLIFLKCARARSRTSSAFSTGTGGDSAQTSSITTSQALNLFFFLEVCDLVCLYLVSVSWD